MINGAQVISPYGYVLASNAEPVTLTQEDTLRVSVTFEYMSPHTASTATLHGFIGTPSSHVADGRKEVSLPVAAEFTPKSETVDIPTSTETLPGTYSLYVRIDEQPEVFEEVPGCITVKEKPNIIAMVLPLLILGIMAAMVVPMMKEVKS